MEGISTATRKTTLRIHIRQALFLNRDDISDALLNEIARTLTIENPAFLKAEKAGRWTSGIDKFLKYYELRTNDKGEKFIVLPRGFLLPSLLQLCKRYRVRWELLDHTYTCDPVKFNSKIQLRDYQSQAVGRIMRPCEGKEDAVVFDFIDSEVGILESQAKSRRRMYEELRAA